MTVHTVIELGDSKLKRQLRCNMLEAVTFS
jgi:hypothetical protein